VVYRQPNGMLIWIRPVDAVSAMRRYGYKVARNHGSRLRFVCKAKTRMPFQNDDPLRLFLIIPKPRRTGLSCRYYSLNFHSR